MSGDIEHDMFDPEAAALDELEQQNLSSEQRALLDGYLRRRKSAYANVFSEGPTNKDDLEFVMLDLARFCRMYSTTYDDVQSRMNVAEGRREVYLRIQAHTSLPWEQFLIKYAVANPKG